MIGPPRLEAADLEEVARRYFGEGVRREHRLLAVHGAGERARLHAVEGRGAIEVVPVESELDLRDRLPPLDQLAETTIFLLPWTGELPLDLQGRFARKGRIEVVGRDERLKRRFGVVEVEGAVTRSHLAKVVLEEGFEAPAGVGKLGLGRLWALWLRERFALAWDDDRPTLEAMLAWAAFDDRGPALAARTDAAELRDEWVSLGAPEHRAAMRLVLSAWEARRGRALFELAILAEAASGEGAALARTWLRQRAKAALGGAAGSELDDSLATLGRIVRDALRRVERADVVAARRLVLSADAQIDDPDVRRALGQSRHLPTGWTSRLDALGAALQALADAPRPEAARLVNRRRRALESHDAASDEAQIDTIRRAEMASRLAFWLVVQKAPERTSMGSAYADVELLGRWYVEEGGYVDRARRAARGTESSSAFDLGVAAVVEAADRVRGELDRRFARALPAWVEAGRPSDRVLPLDRVFEKLVVPFLGESEERRLLVLLLDGMAWAQAVEILESLGDRATPWGPAQWHFSPRRGGLPIALANIPSVTDVSRAGFFAGALVASGREHDTQRDPERFRAQERLRPFGDGDRGPRLLLRAEGHTRGGAASAEALSMVEDVRQRLVAIVLNAIDDSLKANPGVRHPWRADNIPALASLLAKAEEVGRSVLLVSDHGHVPADRLTVRTETTKGGARWRELPEGATLGEDEVAFPAGKHVWTPRGARAIALLADDTTKYGGASHAGEHGGASLAEMVAPCVLLGAVDRDPDVRDREVAGRPLAVPGWWYLDEVLLEGEAAAPTPTAPGPRRKKTPAGGSPQLSLGIVPAPSPPRPPPPADERPASAPAEGPLARAFRASPILAKLDVPAERKDQAAAVVALLEAHEGRVAAAAFASRMKVFPRNVPGMVDALRSVLNLDEYVVLSHDRETKEVLLDRERLRQLFELTSESRS